MTSRLQKGDGGSGERPAKSAPSSVVHIAAARREPVILARARRLLSSALEIKGRYGDSLEAVQMYESADSQGPLDAETYASVRVQLGLAYNYSGDHPKAIAVLKAE